MKFFIILSCLFAPFGLAYLIKNMELSWYTYAIIPIIFGLAIGYYLINAKADKQFSLKKGIFKSKSSQ
jgi:hypothetical protein